ncbi:MAG: cell division protein FtsX [Bdellovibrionales bacterium]
MSGYWTGHPGQRIYRWLFGRGRELPLAADGTALALCALLAVMVFLAALGLTGSRVLSTLTDSWSHSHTGEFTVEVRPLAPADGAQPPSLSSRVAAVLDVLRATPGITHAAPLGESEMRRLLAPWLGEDINFQDLPLPVLINASVKPEAVADLPELADRLQRAIPGVKLDDNGAWLKDMEGFVDTLNFTSQLIVLLLGLAAVLTVILVTRVGLLAHRDIVDILHIMGAQDSYLAWQFQTFVARIAFLGSICGALLGVVAIASITGIGTALSLPLLPQVHIGWIDYALILLLPLPAILMAVVVARLSVLLWVRQQL